MCNIYYVVCLQIGMWSILPETKFSRIFPLKCNCETKITVETMLLQVVHFTLVTLKTLTRVTLYVRVLCVLGTNGSLGCHQGNRFGLQNDSVVLMCIQWGQQTLDIFWLDFPLSILSISLQVASFNFCFQVSTLSELIHPWFKKMAGDDCYYF